MFVLPVTSSEICDVTATFKCNKSAGYDSISPNVIKSNKSAGYDSISPNVIKSNKSAGYDSISPNVIKSNKNAGYDSISPNVIKSIIKNIALPLCDAFNKSLWTGCFPDKLKVAKVIPLYKGDDKRLLNNYRPISAFQKF